MSLGTARAAGRAMSLRWNLRGISACAGIVIAAALLLGASPALGAYPGQNGKFVWEQGGCPDCGLALFDRNGSRRITSAGVIGPPGAQLDRDDQFGVISPDGQWVAFERREFKHNFIEGTGVPHPGLYVVRTDGTGLRMLAANPQAPDAATRPTWSRDGARIAFVTELNGGVGVLTIVDATGDPNPRVVAATAGSSTLKVGYPVWSPTDDMFAVTYSLQGQSKGVGLLPADSESGGLTPLRSTSPDAYSNYWQPSWSPDGQRIAYLHRELNGSVGTERVETIKRDGTSMQPVIPFPGGSPEDGAGYASIRSGAPTANGSCGSSPAG